MKVEAEGKLYSVPNKVEMFCPPSSTAFDLWWKVGLYASGRSDAHFTMLLVDVSGQMCPDLYDVHNIGHVAAWELYNVHDREHVLLGWTCTIRVLHV